MAVERLGRAQAWIGGGRGRQRAGGFMAVVDAVRDIDFPRDRQELLAEAGDREIRVSKNLRLSLSEVLERIPEDRWESEGDFAVSLQRHWAAVQFMAVPPKQRPARGGGRPSKTPRYAKAVRVRRRQKRRGARKGKPARVRATGGRPTARKARGAVTRGRVRRARARGK